MDQIRRLKTTFIGGGTESMVSYGTTLNAPRKPVYVTSMRRFSFTVRITTYEQSRRQLIVRLRVLYV